MTKQEKCIKQLQDIGLSVFETNNTVYVRVGAIELELAIYEQEYRARIWDEDNAPEQLTEGWGLVIGCIGHDEVGCRDDEEIPTIFEYRIEAESELADQLMTEYSQVVDGQRNFDEVNTDYYIASVERDGSVYEYTDSDGNLIFRYNHETDKYQ